MQRLALALAAVALVAAVLASPYVAIGAGIGACGTGWIAYRRRAAAGMARLLGAAAMAVGLLGCLFGVLRVVLVLGALGHVERMLGA